jgi:hypothetical protein
LGILAEPLRFIEELKLPKGFSVCELGDQFVTFGEDKYSGAQNGTSSAVARAMSLLIGNHRTIDSGSTTTAYRMRAAASTKLPTSNGWGRAIANGRQEMQTERSYIAGLRIVTRSA